MRVLQGECLNYNEDWVLDKNKLEGLRKLFIKRRVSGIVVTLGVIAARTKSLESFGKSTMAQASDILDIDVACVEFLSGNLRRRNLDWKVRFWIADILGYFKSEDSAKVLKRMMFDKNENKRVRKKALESFEQIVD